MIFLRTSKIFRLDWQKSDLVKWYQSRDPFIDEKKVESMRGEGLLVASVFLTPFLDYICCCEIAEMFDSQSLGHLFDSHSSFLNI